MHCIRSCMTISDPASFQYCFLLGRRIGRSGSGPSTPKRDHAVGLPLQIAGPARRKCKSRRRVWHTAASLTLLQRIRSGPAAIALAGVAGVGIRLWLCRCGRTGYGPKTLEAASWRSQNGGTVAPAREQDDSAILVQRIIFAVGGDHA